MNIERLFTRDVVAVPQSTSLRAAAEIMRDRQVGCLLVTDASPVGQRAIGIVTDRDIVVRAVARSADARETTIAEVMTAVEAGALARIVRTARERETSMPESLTA